MLPIIPNFHPAVVHFPIVLTMVAFAAACASQLFKKRIFASQLATVSHYLLWLAAISAVVAVAFGWLAYNSVNHDDVGHIAMGVHKLWAFSTTAVLVLLALFDIKQHLTNTMMPIYMVCLLGLSSVLVGGTGWFGGELVFRHGIGVISLPAQDIAEGVPYQHDAGVAHKHGFDEHGFEEHRFNENATPQTKLNHEAKSVPDVQKSAMQGHDMSTMPMDEPTQARDHEATNSTEKHAHKISDKQLSTVQDESKPHTHQHKK